MIGENEQSVFDSPGISRDTDLNIEEILNENQSATIKEVEPQTNEIKKPTVPVQPEAPTINMSEKKELSPLEQMKLEKEQKPAGLVVNNDDLKSDGPKKNFAFNEDRMEKIEESISEFDSDLEFRNRFTLIRKPTNNIEYMQLMDEFDMAHLQPDGTYEFYDEETINDVDENGNEVTKVEKVPIEPRWIRPRKEGEPLFDFSKLSAGEKNELNRQIKEEEGIDVPDAVDATPKENTESGDSKKEEMSEEKKKTVEILIDKTGLGGDFQFTEEEKLKIKEASTIKLNEVRTLDISAIRAKASQKSFQDVINTYDTSGSKTSVPFPLSGFKAQMKGMSYGEYTDAATDPTQTSFDQLYKKLSVIYNNMTNISSGPFESFEDFLHNVAWLDIPMGMYGMFVSTEPEEQYVPLTCGRPTCKQGFNWDYTTRNVLKLDRCTEYILDLMKKIVTSSAMEYDKIQKESPIQSHLFIELPYTKFIVEIGYVSAYDYLYNVKQLEDPAVFKEAFGEDPNNVYRINAPLLEIISSVRIPDGEGGYKECYGFKDILEALYHIKPAEIQILIAYYNKLDEQHGGIRFSIGTPVCPHCGATTEDLEVDMDTLVFQMYNRLMNSEIDVSNVQGL